MKIKFVKGLNKAKKIFFALFRLLGEKTLEKSNMQTKFFQNFVLQGRNFSSEKVSLSKNLKI